MPGRRGPTVWFQRVPESKVVKNRVHLDVRVPGEELDPLVDRLLGLGGREVRVEPGFTVLADPEGNELCLTR
ncbi:VOC family protein [Saccharopolyspora tripterygii]